MNRIREDAKLEENAILMLNSKMPVKTTKLGKN